MQFLRRKVKSSIIADRDQIDQTQDDIIKASKFKFKRDMEMFRKLQSGNIRWLLVVNHLLAEVIPTVFELGYHEIVNFIEAEISNFGYDGLENLISINDEINKTYLIPPYQ